MRFHYRTGPKSGVILGGCSLLLLSPILILIGTVYLLGRALVIAVFLVAALSTAVVGGARAFGRHRGKVPQD